jgi:hypothetical protein
MHIHKKVFTKIGLHILLWVLLILYFVFAPDVVTLAFTQNGKPVQVNGGIPAESDRIHFVIEDLASYVKDGDNLYELIGWSFIVQDEGISPELFVREIALISDERNYFFSVRSGHRKPDIPSRFDDIDIDFNSLGLSVLIGEDAIKPGKYRIGIVFRNTSDGSAYYWDKPVYYLVKTPNTLKLERR